jgi:ribosomal protein L37E
MATVKNGEVVTVEPNDDRDAYVKCDRCGRQFQIKHAVCVCRG